VSPSPPRDPSADAGLLGFAQKLMTVLDHGLTTATYKYAVLLGLMDLCLEKTSAQGTAPSMVTTAELAEKVIDLYWSHAAPHPGSQAVLRQNSYGQAEILTRIQRYRARAVVAQAFNCRQARRLDPDGYAALLGFVEFKLAEMPLPRLQRVGAEVDEFVYRVAFQDRAHAVTTRADLRRAGFDNRILFVGNAGERLVALAPLLRPLIQREWTALVARLNRFPEAELEDFLFGSTRTPTKTLRDGLREIQDNRCFYCEETVQRPEVDHFLPWARFADDGLDNLVMADNRCNGSKSAHLAASDHVERWSARFAAGSTVARDLATLAERENWERDSHRTRGVARGLYLHLPEGSPLWQLPGSFEPVDPSRVAAALLSAG
jgi:hypothetical protein